MKNLEPLFNPRGVVVAGASSHPGKFGFVSIHNILASGYQGKMFGLAREAGEVLGDPVLASALDLPEGEVDLVFVCTPPALNEQLIRDCASRGVKAVFMAAGGYGEAGDEGKAAEARLVALCDELGLVMAGPNGQGVVSPGIGLCAQIVAPMPPVGRIGIASQSGNFVSSFENLSVHTGVGISHAISAGNASQLGITDYLEYYADDPDTDVALIYVEGIEDGREFFDRAKAVAAKMPVVVLKGGATSGGQRAAASHTGALASDDVVFDGMCRQAGLIRATDVEQAFEIAATLATQPKPTGDRVAVLTTAGGWGVMAADAISRSELELTPLPDDLTEALNEHLPPRWSHNNPIDLAGGETRETIPLVLDMVAGHPSIDAVVYLGFAIQSNQSTMMKNGPFFPDHGLERITGFHDRQDTLYAEAAAAASIQHGKPVLVCTEMAVAGRDNPGVKAVRDGGRLCYATADRAVAALDRVRWYYRYLEKRS